MIWYDVPKKLKERLDKKSQKITVDCIKENAESILRFYESDVIEHVLEMQMQNKAVRSLIMRDHATEKKNPKDYANAASKLAKSSYLGRGATRSATRSWMTHSSRSSKTTLWTRPP